MRLVKVVISTRPPCATSVRTSPRNNPPTFGRAHLDDRIHQTGRPNHLLDHVSSRTPQLVCSRSGGDVNRLCERAWNSSNASGRLSYADGRRKPNWTSVSLRARPLYTCPRSEESRYATHQPYSASWGRYSMSVEGGAAGRPAIQVTGIIFNAVARSRLPHHLDIEIGALLEALGLEQLARRLQFGDVFGQFPLDRVSAESILS